MAKAAPANVFSGRGADGCAHFFHGPARTSREKEGPLFHRSFAMSKKVFVGNLGSTVTGSDLTKWFAAHGTVQSSRVVMNRETGLSKGFGLVEMGTSQEARAAIAALNGKDSGGRPLKVKVARLKPESRRRPGTEGTGG
jgi:RNA recognition motif-containing protein